MKKLLFLIFLLAAQTGRAQDRTGIADLWSEESEWDVYYTDEGGAIDGEDETKVTYSLKRAEDGYMALVKTVITDGVMGTPLLQGYIRNDKHNMVYVRPVMDDGSIGREYLLYDFSVPFEYGATVRYGTMDGNVVEEYIDWRKGSLEYYMLKGGDGRCLPAWKGIVYGYGYLGGPMELFLMKGTDARRPKASNISHVIFTTKGKSKILRMDAAGGEGDVLVPYEEMLAGGTSWECLAITSLSWPYNAHTHTLQVEKDTIIASRRCRIVDAHEGTMRRTLFEEGRKVYVVDDGDTPRAVLDFGQLKGDFFADRPPYVVDIDTVHNQGYEYRRIRIDTFCDCASYFAGDTIPWMYDLIEGIGPSKDYFLDKMILSCTDYSFSYLLRCWKNGKLVYQAPGYETAAGIVTTRQAPASHLYDLLGRRLLSAPAKGIYLKDGKKMLAP